MKNFKENVGKLVLFWFVKVRSGVWSKMMVMMLEFFEFIVVVYVFILERVVGVSIFFGYLLKDSNRGDENELNGE